MTKVLTDQRSIRIKGRSFLAVVLSPESPVDQWLERLDDLAARSAGFFLSRPVVLDVSELTLDKAGLKSLLAALTERNVGIMGIEGVRPSMIEPGMPPSLKGGKPASDVEVEPVAVAAELPEEKPRAAGEIRAVVQSLVINEPVRSGQSIMFPEGDVTGYRFGRLGCGNHRRWFGAYLWRPAWACHGRFARQRLGAHLLPQARGGASGHRWCLQGC